MMRKLLAATSIAAFLIAPVAARAEKLDMSTVTCEQLAGMTEDQVAWYLIWLDGWLAGQADDTTLDVEALGAQIDGIAKECQENPSLSVINAAKAYLDE